MKYMDVGCNINCWECTRNCEIKEVMKISLINPILEKAFYYSIIQFLKPQAGLLITQGKNPDDVTEDMKILSVSFFVARKKLAETLHKK